MLVEQLLIVEVVRLVSFAKGIETTLANHFYASSNLLMAESVAGTQEMLIFTRAVDEDGLAIKAEAVVGIVGNASERCSSDGISTLRGVPHYGWPREGANAEGGAHVVGGDEGGLAVGVVVGVDGGGLLQHRCEDIEVRVFEAPAVSGGDRSRLADDNGLAGFYAQPLATAEDSLAVGLRELADQFGSLWITCVVVHLGLDEDAVAGSIGPDMDTEGLYAQRGGLDECHGTEDAKGLAALAKAVL